MKKKLYAEYVDSITKTTKKYPKGIQDHPLSIIGLGLGEEVGEVLGELKKSHRNDDGEITEERRNNLVDELGDVMFYYVNLLVKLDISLEEVMVHSLDKISK